MVWYTYTRNTQLLARTIVMGRPNDRPRLTPGLIEELKGRINPDTGKLWTQSDIAREWGVTRQAVSLVKHKHASFSRTPRERAMDAWPWEVPAVFQHAWPHKCLRDHLEYMATGGRGMSDYKLNRLSRFYDYLERNNVVVEYDPEIPPSEGLGTGGWAYRKRLDSDGDLIIRVNSLTDMNEESRRLLRLPPRKP